MTDTKHLDDAARLAGFENWPAARDYSHRLDCQSIKAHADTLAKLEAVEAEFAAFKAEVSEAVTDALKGCGLDALKQAYIAHRFSRFIIEKPDPEYDAMREALPGSMPDHHVKAILKNYRAALARHNLEIVEKAHD